MGWRSCLIFISASFAILALVAEANSAVKETFKIVEEKDWPPINYNAHIFYYPWYKNESFDGVWFHWEQAPKRQYTPEPVTYHPPKDISSNFYPLLGTYSCNDSNVVDQHMRWIRSTGVGVVALSWYPPMYAPSKNANVDDITPQIFDIANRYKLKVTFMMERWKSKGNQTYGGETLKIVCKYITETYGKHPAFYRTKLRGRPGARPLYYMYLSNAPEPSSWRKALRPGGDLSVRGTPYDAYFTMLFLGPSHFGRAYDGGFDALFTYFTTKDCCYASTWSKWPEINQIAKGLNLTFIPSFGPGYNDTRIRPYKAWRVSGRDDGRYFEEAYQHSQMAQTNFISITSFNEWHEGAIIEPAIPWTSYDTYNPVTNKTHSTFVCADYRPHQPTFYLDVTRKIADSHRKSVAARGED